MKKSLFFFFSIVASLSIPQTTNTSWKKIRSWIGNQIGSYKEKQFYQEFKVDTPKTIILENISGDITIKTWNVPSVVIEAAISAPEKDLDTLSVEATQHHEINVKSICKNPENRGTIDYAIMMPATTNITIQNKDGNIKIKNAAGTITATTQGSIEIFQASNNIIAQATSLAISVKDLPHAGHIIAQAEKNIELFLPPTISADFSAKTDTGVITSDLFITLKGKITQLNKKMWQDWQRAVEGTLAKGGATIKVYAKQGNISLKALSLNN